MAQMNPEDDPRNRHQSTPLGPNTGSHAPTQPAPAPAQPRAGSQRDQVTPLGPGVVDRGAFNYGGSATGAQDAAAKLTDQGIRGQARQGEQINTANADGSRQNSLNDREMQLSMADMMRRATGQTPSIAGMRADQDMGRVAAEQTSQQASARGPAALALAQQGAAANTAGAQGAISNSAQINSANERMQAEQTAFGAYTGIRGGDQSQQGQDFAQSAAQAQMNAAQRAQNDQYQLANQQQGIGVQGMQLSADMNRDAAEQSGHFNAAGLQEQKNAAHDSSVMGYVNAGIQGASALGSMAAMVSDEATKVPITWGGGGTPEPIAAPSTWGTGAGTSSLDMSKMIAHQALSDQAGREFAASGRQQAMGGGGGPMMAMGNAGVGALKQRDAEDVGLAQAKERNGLELSDREAEGKASAQHRISADRGAAAKALDVKPLTDAASKAQAPKDASGAAGAMSKATSSLKGVGEALQAGAQRSGPSWQYSGPAQHQLPSLAPLSTSSDEKAKTPARKMSMAELMRAADAMQAGTDAQRTTLKSGSAVGGDRLEREGRAMAEHTEAQRAMLDSGPSVGGHEDTGAENYDRRGSGMGRALRTTSDDHAKVAIAQREAFSAGLAHANEAAETGKIGEAPAYMREKPSTEKRQPAAPAARAASTTVAKQDGAHQRGVVRASSQDTARAAIMTNPVMPLSVQMGGQLMQDDVEGRSRAMRQHPEESTSDERAKVGHLGREMPVDDMAEAARSLKAVPYAYKPGFAGEEGQKPGEVNIGPVAQEMQKSPVAATAVKQDSPDGLRSIDIPKYTKVLGGIAASQQEQLDEQQRQISFMASRLRSKR